MIRSDSIRRDPGGGSGDSFGDDEALLFGNDDDASLEYMSARNMLIGSGAASWYVKDLNGSINGVAYGMDPTGATDSLAAFTLAAMAASAARKTLVIPAGTYVSATEWLISVANLRIVAHGAILRTTAKATNTLRVNANRVNVEGIETDGQSTNLRGILVDVGCQHVKVHQCRAHDFASGAADNLIPAGILVRAGTVDVKVLFNEVSGVVGGYTGGDASTNYAATGIKVQHFTGETPCQDVLIHGNRVIDVSPEDNADGIHVIGATNYSYNDIATVRITQNYMMRCHKRGIKIQMPGVICTGNDVVTTYRGAAFGEPTMYAGISVYGRDSIVTNNRIKGGYLTHGIEIGASQEPADGSLVEANEIMCEDGVADTLQAAGISFAEPSGSSGGTSWVRSIVVKGNHVRNWRYGMRALHNIEGFLVEGNLIENTLTDGIRLGDTAAAQLINGQVVNNEFVNVGGSGVGINTTSILTNVGVSGNRGTTVGQLVADNVWKQANGVTHNSGLLLTTALKTGTASVTKSSRIITGLGTTFATEFAAGQLIKLGDGSMNQYRIASVDSPTQITLNTFYVGATAAGLTVSLVTEATPSTTSDRGNKFNRRLQTDQEFGAYAVGTPGALTLVAGGGGSLPAGTYYYSLVALDGNGQASLPGAEASIVINGTTETSVAVSYSRVAGAAQYRIYRGTAPGTVTGFKLVTLARLSTTDDGSALTAASSLPSFSQAWLHRATNTTWYTPRLSLLEVNLGLFGSGSTLPTLDTDTALDQGAVIDSSVTDGVRRWLRFRRGGAGGAETGSGGVRWGNVDLNDFRQHRPGSAYLQLDYADYAAGPDTLAMLQRWLQSGHVALGAPPTVPSGADLANGMVSMSLDEAGAKLTFTVKYSDGTSKTGTVNLV